MLTNRDLLAEIKRLIGSLPSNIKSSSSLDNVYEVYLFTLVLRAAQAEGANVILRDQSNPSPRRLHFRSSPGYLNSNIRSYSYAEIVFPNKPILEAHLSVRVSGRSSVLHECDVCILYQTEANLCRQSQDRVAPRSSKVLLNIEAKYYTTSLTLSLGRSYIGLVSDLGCDSSFFITNTASDSIEKLLSHKGKDWEHNIKPKNLNETNRLIFSIQAKFKNFKAK